MILAYLVRAVVAIPILFVVLHTMVRIVRHYRKFPMPEFMADLIDNPLRRRFQPPYKMAVRHGLKPGMKVLEIGAGFRLRTKSGGIFCYTLIFEKDL
jgi:hypothetical protein